MKILLGFYSGIGDLVTAIPVIKHIKKSVEVTLAITKELKVILDIFDVEYKDLIFFNKKISLTNIKFFRSIKEREFTKIIFSPHALCTNSSRNLPICVKLFKNRNSLMSGALHQKLSYLFDYKININYLQNCTFREFDLLQSTNVLDDVPKESLNKLYLRHKYSSIQKEKRVCIHIGASKRERTFSTTYWVDLIHLFTQNKTQTIVILGLKGEVESIKRAYLNTHKAVKNLDFYYGSIEDCLKQFARSSLVITMDTGFGHIASLMNLNHFVILGGANIPLVVAPIFKNTKLISNNILEDIKPKYIYDTSMSTLEETDE